MYMDDEGKTLASEILAELKASAKRWFIAFCIMVFVELATIVGFIWYISLPVETTVDTIDQDATDRGFNIISGGDYIGGPSENNKD